MSKLLIVHSLYESKLLKAINIGGFPLPSLAVIKPDNPYTRFGKITFIVNPEVVNPNDKKNVFFDRDIFSQRFPDPEYKLDKKQFKLLNKEFDEYIETKDKSFNSLISIHDFYNYSNKSYDYTRSKLLNDSMMKMMFLDNHKIAIDIPFKSDSFESSLSYYLPLHEYMINHDNVRDIIKDPTFSTLINEAIYKQFEGYKKDLGESVARDIYQSMNNAFFDKDDNLSTYSGEFTKLMADSRKLDLTANIIDVNKLEKNIRSLIDINQIDYEDWIDSKLATVYIEPHLKIGSKKLEFNLENIEKYMLKQSIKSVEDVNDTNIGMISSRNAKQFKKFEDMFDKIDSLKNSEDREQHLNSINKRISELGNHLISAYEDTNYFSMNNSIANTLAYISDMDTAKNQLKKNYFNIDKIKNEQLIEIIDIANEIKTLSVHYFEGKPQKTLNFDDFQAVILPDNINPSIAKLLPESLKKHYYNHSNESERVDIFKQYSFESVKPKRSFKLA